MPCEQAGIAVRLGHSANRFDGLWTVHVLSVSSFIIVYMFDRCPGVSLVADLVASRADPPVARSEDAARSLIEQLMAWQRVSAWVEWHRLDTMRRFERARTEADRDLAEGTGR
jgi:hypothetical protein